MKLGVIKESKAFEKRVALTPDVVKALVKKNFQVVLEKGAGEASSFSDADYEQVGASVTTQAAVFQETDVYLKVNAFTLEEVQAMQPGRVCISFLYAYTIPEIVHALNEKKISAFSMDAVPRISRAQKMDALSSQANLAGYKTVLLGANALGKIFPLMMTAAGTITPSKVLIFGAGVAGLQAIATAKRLGAVVEVFDTRPAVKEEVQSLGAKFIEVEGAADASKAGGYAVEQTEEFKQRQRERLAESVAKADVVITTAAIPGKNKAEPTRDCLINFLL